MSVTVPDFPAPPAPFEHPATTTRAASASATPADAKNLLEFLPIAFPSSEVRARAGLRSALRRMRRTRRPRGRAGVSLALRVDRDRHDRAAGRGPTEVGDSRLVEHAEHGGARASPQGPEPAGGL